MRSEYLTVAQPSRNEPLTPEEYDSVNGPFLAGPLRYLGRGGERYPRTLVTRGWPTRVLPKDQLASFLFPAHAYLVVPQVLYVCTYVITARLVYYKGENSLRVLIHFLLISRGRQ